MRIIVSGSRKLTDKQLVWDALDKEYYAWLPMRLPLELFVVVHGKAKGADTFADEWARQGLAYAKPEGHGANWDLLGGFAGAERNGRMVAKGADKVLAFPRGIAKGTRDLMKQARAAEIPVRKL